MGPFPEILAVEDILIVGIPVVEIQVVEILGENLDVENSVVVVSIQELVVHNRVVGSDRTFFALNVRDDCELWNL